MNNYTYNFYNAQDAFEYYYSNIMKDGFNINNTKAFFNVGFYIQNPLNNSIDIPWRNWKEDYAKKEWEWYLSGDQSAIEIAKEAKIWKNMMDENGNVNSNYGHWWKKGDQLNYVIDLLKKDITTRRAVIVHYNPEEVNNYEKDTPCNLVLNFCHYNNTLNLSIFARSIDLVFGFCNDQYMFSNLLQLVCKEIGIEPGNIFYQITNLHIYERHFNLKK
jgi:thymidylate synthase